MEWEVCQTIYTWPQQWYLNPDLLVFIVQSTRHHSIDCDLLFCVQIVEAGALPHLVKMLQSKKEDKQYTAARVLWTLCFDDDVKKQIEAEEGCVEALQELSNSENSGVKKQASGTLWKIQEEQNKKGADDMTKDNEGHIMISYNWGSKEMVLQIKEQLQVKTTCTYTVNPRFKPRGLINFMVHNHPGSNRERGQIETINLSNLLTWMGKLTWV